MLEKKLVLIKPPGIDCKELQETVRIFHWKYPSNYGFIVLDYKNKVIKKFDYSWSAFLPFINELTRHEDPDYAIYVVMQRLDKNISPSRITADEKQIVMLKYPEMNVFTYSPNVLSDMTTSPFLVSGTNFYDRNGEKEYTAIEFVKILVDKDKNYDVINGDLNKYLSDTDNVLIEKGGFFIMVYPDRINNDSNELNHIICKSQSTKLYNLHNGLISNDIWPEIASGNDVRLNGDSYADSPYSIIEHTMNSFNDIDLKKETIKNDIKKIIREQRFVSGKINKAKDLFSEDFEDVKISGCGI